MDLFEIREVSSNEIDETSRVIARGMSDNPHHLRDFGITAEHRMVLCERLYRTVLPLILSRGIVLAAYKNGAIVGALGAVRPGECEPSLPVQIWLAATFFVTLGPSRALRTLKWMKARIAYDPREPHWHLGPVAVAAEWRGQGIGTAMMHDFCQKITRSSAGSATFLETESVRNVRFYERFGFSTLSECCVLGVPTWSMMRYETTGMADGQSLLDTGGR